MWYNPSAMKCHALGLDLGSRRTKFVLWDGEHIITTALFDSWSIARERISEQIIKHPGIPVGTTGYHRKMAGECFQARILTEIKAFSLGSRSQQADVRTIIDIGGQDAKVIQLDEAGHTVDFDMNDRCAAGTGKFFEIIAGTLGIPFAELSEQALQARTAVPISSTCAVFAESEIISRLAEGLPAPDLARGVFRAVAERLHAMLGRIVVCDPVIMVGGGACACLATELSALISLPVIIPPQGEFFGALGAALFARKECSHD
jgi:predicted CoA-substrate-specific enzyme activase